MTADHPGADGSGASGHAPAPGVMSARPPSWGGVPAIWAALCGIAAALMTLIAAGPVWGTLVLAVVPLGAGAWRLVAPPPGPEGLVIRSRPVDVALYGACAVGLAFLAVTTPGL